MDFFFRYELTLEYVSREEIVIHRVCHNLGHRGGIKFDKAIMFTSPCLNYEKNPE